MGLLACASADRTVAYSRGGDAAVGRILCSNCDIGHAQKKDPVENHELVISQILRFFDILVAMPNFLRLRQARVAAANAVIRISSHASNKDVFDLSKSTVGQWCLQALQSSIRELRIAAGRTVPLYISRKVPGNFVQQNRVITLDFMRNLSSRTDLAFQETFILAWGQFVRQLDDGDEVNLGLLKLVEYLGHPSSLLCGLAFDELQRICNHSSYSALRLFAPYWRTVAVAAVQDLHRRPQVIQQLSDLLGISIADFLVRTQVYTVPYYVLTKRQDILQKIAEACNQSVMSLCREHNNLAAILSTILLQAPSEAETYVMALLNAISTEFQHVDCIELLKSEPQATAAELLKSAGDLDESQKNQASLCRSGP